MPNGAHQSKGAGLGGSGGAAVPIGAHQSKAAYRKKSMFLCVLLCSALCCLRFEILGSAAWLVKGDGCNLLPLGAVSVDTSLPIHHVI